MTYVRCMCISYVSPARWRTSTVTIRKTVHLVHLVYVVSTESTRSESLLIINPESEVLPHVMPETQ